MSLNPSNQDEWIKWTNENDVSATSIHDLDNYDSGSKIRVKQYLTLRVLWKPILGFPDDISRGWRARGFPDDGSPGWLDINTAKHASEFLGNQSANMFSTSWEQYLDDIHRHRNEKGSSNRDIGLMSLVRYFQQSVKPHQHEADAPSTPKVKLVRRTRNANVNYVEEMFEDMSITHTPLRNSRRAPSPQSPTPAYAQIQAEDEQLVNSALLIFLISVTSYHPSLCSRNPDTPTWSLVRKSFQFGENSSENQWTAITDGYLRIGKDKVMGIVEVKPYSRTTNEPKIQRQEAAQMAAWIYQRPEDHMYFHDRAKDNRKWRLLVSQDADEIHLTFAVYDDNYQNYLCGKKPATSFMTMFQYGPYFTNRAEHMKKVGEFILAFTLQQLLPPSPAPRPSSKPTSPDNTRQTSPAYSSSSSDNGGSSGTHQRGRTGRSPPGVIRPIGPTEDLTSVRKKLFTEPTNAPPDRRQQSSAPLRPSHGSGDQPRDASRASADRRQPPPAFLRPSHGSGDRSRDASTSSHSSGNRSRDPSRASADRREQRPSAPPPQNPVLGGNGMGRADGYQGQTSDSLVKKPWYKKL